MFCKVRVLAWALQHESCSLRVAARELRHGSRRVEVVGRKSQSGSCRGQMAELIFAEWECLNLSHGVGVVE